MLLFLSPIWRHMGANPVWTSTFSRNLLELLNNNRVEWVELKPLLVWTVYFAAIETRDLGQRALSPKLSWSRMTLDLFK
jgi:hypothetical protein